MELLERYVDAKKGLAMFKKLEGDLRVALLEELFPAATEGSSKTVIGDLKITGNFKINRTIDAEMLKEVMEDLSSEELDCIKYKASLSLSKYKLLEESEREMLDEAITTKPAMPTIKIESEI